MPNWIMKINTGQHIAKFEDGQATLRETAMAVANELDKAERIQPMEMLGAFEDLTNIAENFRDVTDDVEEFDGCLNDMYDWGDYWRVWFVPVGLVNSEAK